MKKNMTRRSFLKKSAGTLLAMTGASVGGRYYAHNVEPDWLDIKSVSVQHPLIPSGFNGTKIVQFSDTHLGFQFQLEDLQSIASKIQALSPDIILFTGDLMDEPNKYSKQNAIIPLLSMLSGTLGKFCVYGNHDHGGNGSEIYKKIMESAGFTLLQNKSARISLLNGDTISISGIDDAMLGSPDLNTALSDIPENIYSILLSHAPDLADSVLDYNVQLQLSGHSHGGQVQIPFFGALVTPPFAEKYTDGTYELQGLTLHVNRGLGTTRLPYRFLARPEITIFELQSGKKK